LHLTHDFPSHIRRSSVLIAALGNGTTNPILGFYSSVEMQDAGRCSTRRRDVTEDSPAFSQRDLSPSSSGCRKIHSKLSDGKHRFTDSFLNALFLTDR